MSISHFVNSGFHPFFPERLGLRRLLRVLNSDLATLLDQTDPFTLITARRRVTLFREAVQVLERGVPGDFVEIGVHRGGSAGVLAHLLKEHPDRRLHLFDRWGDLPDPTPEDGHRQQQYSRENNRERLQRMKEKPPLLDVKRIIHEIVGLPVSAVRYYQGWYEQTLGTTSEYPGTPIAFASIDCDYYQSLKEALAFVGRHASPGATVVVDDFRTWPGVAKAVQEFINTYSGKVELRRHRRINQAVLSVHPTTQS